MRGSVCWCMCVSGCVYKCVCVCECVHVNMCTCECMHMCVFDFVNWGIRNHNGFGFAVREFFVHRC